MTAAFTRSFALPTKLMKCVLAFYSYFHLSLARQRPPPLVQEKFQVFLDKVSYVIIVSMLKVYKYRIYPTKAQRRKIHQTLDSESAGRTFVKVNPAGTSQRCYRCGTSVPKDLSVRWHQCPICHLSIDRDVNSAKEILRLGHQSLEANLTMLPRSPHL